MLFVNWMQLDAPGDVTLKFGKFCRHTLSNFDDVFGRQACHTKRKCVCAVVPNDYRWLFDASTRDLGQVCQVEHFASDTDIERRNIIDRV